MLQKPLALALPLLSMAVVVVGVYLVARYWPGAHPGRMPDKVAVVHHRSSPPPARPVHKAPHKKVAAAREGKKRRVRPPVDSGRWTTRYDGYFRKYTKRFFGVGFDWRWFKSQAIVESTLNPAAHSHAGAVGLMQITPLTYKDIRRRKPHAHNLHSPRWNIAAGIGYMRYLYEKDALRALPSHPRLYLSFASYNAGYTGILRVMRTAPPKKVGWRDTLKHAPRQTRHYVKRIIEVKTGAY